MIRLALISDSVKVSGGDLFRMAPALEQNALHCWRAWRPHLPAFMQDTPPSVIPWDDSAGGRDGRALPPWEGVDHSHLCPLYFVDDNSRDSTSLAIHYVQGDRPAGRVYVQNTSGLNAGSNSACESAAHEIVEMIVNAWIDMWRPMPGRPGLFVAQESADPVQDHYTVESHGEKWRVANYVTPAWFGLGDGDKMDHLGTLSQPGEVGPEGYLILRDHDWRVRYEFGARKDGFSAREMNSKTHPLCRTRRIIEASTREQGRHV